MSNVEYSHLLFEISQRLDLLDQHEHLLFMCRRYLASRPEDIPDALSLFRELEEQNNLAIDQVELLKELLKGFGEWSSFQKVETFEYKRKDYKELLEQISRALDESNQLQQLISVCTAKETLDENERNTQTARILFEKLESRGLFEFGRLDFLKGILLGIERQDLVRKVQDFEKRRIDEDEFERRKAQARSIVAAARVVGGRVIGVLNMKTVFGVAAAGITLLTVREILTRWSTYDQLVTCFQGCVLPAGSRLIEVSQGCVCFTIQVDNLTGLTALWNMYEDGTLRERLFKFFVTDEMKTRAGGEENVELTVTIEKAEYEKAYFELVQEADGNQKRPPERGVRRHSDSVLSLPPRTAENSLITIAQLKNQVKSLEERIEAVETQMVPFEKGPAKVPGRKCEHSDSVISTTPNEDETLQVKVKRLENDVQLLKERAESQEKQMTRLSREFFGTRMATEIIPAEEGN
nr:uncharacterized protein LOC131777555 [Pocillopora verrucosa]